MLRTLVLALVGVLAACTPHLRGFPDGSSVAPMDAPGVASAGSAQDCAGVADEATCLQRSATSSPAVPSMEHLATLYGMGELQYKPMERGQGALVVGGAPSGADLLVLPGRDRQIRAVDTRTGELVWSVETLGMNAAAPVIVGGDIIVASLDGTVRRLSTRNGRPVWQTEPLGVGGILTAPAVAGDRLFVTTTDNRLIALEIETGKRLWDRRRPHRSDLTISGQAGALVLGERVVTGTSDGQVVAYAVSDGATDWSVNLAGDADEFVDVDATPVLAGDVVVTAGYATGLVGLSRKDGAVLWTVPGEGFTTAAVDSDGIVYAPQASGRLTAVVAQTGAVLWTSQFREGTPTRPVIVQGTLLVPMERSLLVMDARNGRVRTSFDDGFGFAASPVVGARPSSRVYVPANSGHLYTLNFQ